MGIYVSLYLLIGAGFAVALYFRMNQKIKNNHPSLAEAEDNLQAIPGGMVTLFIGAVLIWPLVAIKVFSK